MPLPAALKKLAGSSPRYKGSRPNPDPIQNIHRQLFCRLQFTAAIGASSFGGVLSCSLKLRVGGQFSAARRRPTPATAAVAAPRNNSPPPFVSSPSADAQAAARRVRCRPEGCWGRRVGRLSPRRRRASGLALSRPRSTSALPPARTRQLFSLRLVQKKVQCCKNAAGKMCCPELRLRIHSLL